MGLDEKIMDIYVENYYPSLNELYKLLIEEGIKITKSKVKDFLDLQHEQQITKEVKTTKRDMGHIVAFATNQFWELDIFILQKYVNDNHGYRDILCAVDVFTRRAYCEPMKNKELSSVVDAFKNMIHKHGTPEKILSDSDSTFTSSIFQEIINKNKIFHEFVPVGDHMSLGIVDRFARTLKTKLTKIFIARNNSNWVDHLSKVIEKYNNSPHSGLGNIKPNEADDPYNTKIIAELNHIKSLKNNSVSDLSIGNKVRILDRGTFDKGTEPQFSNEVYIVKAISGKNITLNNDVIKKRYKLLHVPDDTKDNKEKNIIKTITKKHKISLLEKKEDTKVENIREGTRIRKKRDILDI